MNTQHAVHSFPTSHVRNNNVSYFITLAATMGAIVYGAVSYLQYINPFAMSQLSAAIITVFSCTALIIVVNRSYANARRNEKNRLNFSQQVRHITRNRLQRPMTLEQVDSLFAGKVVTVDNFQMWLSRKGRTTTLMTNKMMGKIPAAMKWELPERV